MEQEYTNTNTLSPQSQRLLIRTISRWFINKCEGNNPPPNIRKQIANAIKAIFPSLYTNTTMLLHSDTSEGPLGIGLRNAKAHYKRSNRTSVSSISSQDSSQSTSLSQSSQMDPISTPSSSQSESPSLGLMSLSESAQIDSPLQSQEMEVTQQPPPQMNETSQHVNQSPDRCSPRQADSLEPECSQSKSNSPEPLHASEIPISDSPQVLSVENELYEFLKTVVVSKNNYAKIQSALQFTKDFRRADPDHMINLVNLFLQEPKLIVFDFELTYGDKASNFLNQTYEFAEKVEKIFEEKFPKKNCGNYDEEALPYVKLMFLVNSKTTARTISSLFQFAPSHATTNDIKTYQNDHKTPCIVVQSGPTNKFFISFDDKIISLKNEDFPSFDFVFDFCYKLYHVYNIKYPKELDNFFSFFDKMIFEMDVNIQKNLKNLNDTIESYTS